MKLQHALLAVLLLLASPARALQFVAGEATDGAILIEAVGEVVAGDTDRFRTALAGLPARRKAAGLLLDSPGGLVGEAEDLARLVHDTGIAVLVTRDAKCVSACFLLFAAGKRRFAADNALIGVHSAAEAGGKETMFSYALTTHMARVAASYGVPPEIIGKMVQMRPGGVEWLTRDDLVSMGVGLLQGDQIAPSSWPDAARPTGRPAPEAAYRGAFFCGAGPAALSLSRAGETGAVQRVVVGFGPTATNPGMPAGSFLAEGRFDAQGGVIDLKPVTWLVQPAGFAITGLLGQSDDGGRIFLGRIAAAPEPCSVFTLKRAD